MENPSFDQMGIVLSRRGASRNCQESIFRSLLGPEHLKILVLTEADLFLMLEYVDAGRNALDVLERKYGELVLKL